MLNRRNTVITLFFCVHQHGRHNLSDLNPCIKNVLSVISFNTVLLRHCFSQIWAFAQVFAISNSKSIKFKNVEPFNKYALF